MRIPRKLKKQIPTGPYCYTPISGFVEFEPGVWGIRTKVCPFFTYIKYKDIPKDQWGNWMDQEYVDEFGEESVSWCKLIKSTIDDQCKSCDFKRGY